MKQLAVPQVDKLLAKVRLHVVTKNIAQPVQQRLLVGRPEQRERVLIDVDHPDFAHATGHELGMHVGEHAQVADAAAAHLIEQALDAGEILDPQGNRRMLKQSAGVLLAQRLSPPRALPCGNILDRDQNPPPVVLVSAGPRLQPRYRADALTACSSPFD